MSKNKTKNIKLNSRKLKKIKRKKMSQSKFTIAETFVGCGGAHFGFKKENFHTVFVNDIWNDAITTLKNNDDKLTEHNVICDDIYNIDKKMLKDKKINYKDLDVFIGGVVCKGFSLAGVRNPFDERNYLYQQQLRLVELLKPKISIIENVPGMLNMKILKKNNNDEDIKKLCNEIDDICTKQKTYRGQLIAYNKSNNVEKAKEHKALLAELKIKRKELEKNIDQYKYKVVDDIQDCYEKMGYTVYKKILNCSHYGCATSRRRLFIVAVRNDLDIKWEYPTETTVDNPPTVKQALDLLDYEGINNPSVDIDNQPMNHRASTVEKFKKVIAGVKQEGSYFSRGTSSRLSNDKPAPTLVPGHSSFQIHPSEHRSITVREGGIITGFDKDFKFYGSHSSRCMQIGNAIPVNMANNLAKQCKKYLEKIKK